MAQDSNAPDQPASSRDREALAAIARQIAAVDQPGRSTATANGADAANPGHTPADCRASDPPGAGANRPGLLGPDTISSLLQVLPGGIALCAGGALILCNEAFALAFGYKSPDDLIAAGGIATIFPELCENPDAILDQARSGARPRVVTLRARSRSGRRFELPLAVQRPSHDEAAPTLLVLHPSTEVPEEPPQEPSAQELRPETMLGLADGVSDGLVRLDADGAIAALSPKAAALLDLEDGAAGAPAFRSLLSEPDRPALARALARLTAAPDAAAGDRLDVRLAAGDGHDANLSLSLAKAPRQPGQVWLMLHSPPPAPEPVPEPQQPEPHEQEAAEPQDREATEASERRSPALPDTANLEFLAKVSHEVRTPLNSIIGFAELMRDQRFGPIGNSRYRGYVDDIYESGVYALSLINDLLDISKLESGKFELNFTAVDANEVIAESVHVMQPQARRGRVVLRMSLADTLPHVLADRRTLKQILLNLLSNAVKFTDSGGQVVVSSRRDADGGIHVGVRDNGIGMSEADIKQAMQPFEQLDTAPRKQVGTGLGLPLTKALVEASHAVFKLESGAGLGTRIDIVFPADRLADG